MKKEICKIADKLSMKQINDLFSEEEQAEFKIELSKHFAECKDEGCIECLNNRVRVGIQDLEGNVLN